MAAAKAADLLAAELPRAAECVQQGTRQRRQPFELVAMCHRQPRQQGFGPGRELKPDLATIHRRGPAPDQRLGDQPVDESNRAVVTDGESGCQIADGGHRDRDTP